jgi:guanylate kinase
MRRGERNGVDYWFMATDEFARRVAAGEFVEHAIYSGNRYGTLRAPLEAARAAGRVFVLEIEVQGTKQLREAGLDAIYLFVAPPSLEEIRRRLVARGTDDEAEIERRLAIAERELEAQELYDHVVVNRDLDTAIAEVRRLVGL